MSDRFAHFLLIAIGFFSLVQSAQAQVTQIAGSLEVRLSGYCETIQQERTRAGSLGDFRVKRGGQITVTGVRQTVFIEEGGVADIRGTASLVYVAKGGKATVAGERNVVYAERGANIATVGRVTMTSVDTLILQLHQNGIACQ
ncbi:MAG: hypothetical protein ACKVON_05295 [Beijerinckiaceae bacterium]